MAWSETTDHASPESYWNTYHAFVDSIEREGKLIYYGVDPKVTQLAQAVRSDMTAIAFDTLQVVEREGQTFLQTRFGDFPVRMPNRFFLVNLPAAQLVCRQLGVKDALFYQALSAYSLSLPL